MTNSPSGPPVAGLGRARAATARVCLSLAVVMLFWAAVLLLLGGVDVHLFGWRLRSHDVLRPLTAAAVLLAAYVPLYGAVRVHDIWWRLTRRLDDGPVAAGLAIFVTIVGVAYSSTAAAGSDSYGYVSQADLWLKGDLHVPQPWAAVVPWPTKSASFMPLGYRPPDDTQLSVVPTYSPGLPLLMAAATYAAGRAAAFWIVPICGGLLVLATFGIGRRFGLPRAGLIAAWLVATSPIVLYMLMLPMSDVPAAAAWAVALYGALGVSIGSAAMGGAAAAVAILIRPNLVPLAAVLALAYVAQLVRARTGRIACLTQLAVFIACASVGAIATGVINRKLYGSPIVSGYGAVGDYFSARNVLPNLRLYSGWLVHMQTPLVLCGVAALVLPVRWLWRSAPRAAVGVAVLFASCVWIAYLPYLQFEHWTYLRFLLPSWPILMLGVAVVALSLARGGSPGRVLAIAGVVLYLGIYDYCTAAQAGAFDTWRSERASVLAARETRRLTPPNSIVLSMFHSGSVRYYGERMTVRYDLLDSDWLDRAVSWLDAHGAHPYLLVNDWEIPMVTGRFRSQRTVARLREEPVFVFDGAAKIFLYDLAPATTGRRVWTVADTTRQLRAIAPGAMPSLALVR